jgi:hypothetical protein
MAQRQGALAPEAGLLENVRGEYWGFVGRGFCHDIRLSKNMRL